MTEFDLGPSKSDIIWASETFLCEKLPDDYDEWDDDKFFKFLEDNVWEPFENKSRDIWDHIETLALSVRIYIKEEN